MKKSLEETEELFEELKRVKACGQKTLDLQRTPRRKERLAKLTVRFATIELQAPKGKEEIKLGIVIQAILAEEKKTPAGEKSVSNIPFFKVKKN